jgi:hypothetical protein
MKRIVAVDIGYRNLAMCQLNAAEDIISLTVTLTDLTGGGGKPSRRSLFDLTIKWCEQNAAVLESADIIVLETQMRKQFEVMNTIIMARYPHKSVELAPATLCAVYRMPRKRDEKKLATQKLVRELFPQLLESLASQHKKLDDLADAILMAHWAYAKRQRPK